MMPGPIGDRLRRLAALLPDDLGHQWHAVGESMNAVGVPFLDSYMVVAAPVVIDEDNRESIIGEQIVTRYIATFGPCTGVVLADLLDAIPDLLSRLSTEVLSKDCQAAVSDVLDIYCILVKVLDAAISGREEGIFYEPGSDW